jgi:uncharacterized protein YndB with AHSA1/START domain
MMPTTFPTRITAHPGLPFVDIERELDAPRDLVFRAYAEPELLAQWLGPRRYTTTIERYEVRDGGRWQYTSRDDDGNAYVFHGVFHGEQTPDRMTQTFEFDGAPGMVALDTLVLEDHGDRTIVRTHSIYPSLEARDGMVAGGMAEGVSEGMDRLTELLERLKAGDR